MPRPLTVEAMRTQTEDMERHRARQCLQLDFCEMV